MNVTKKIAKKVSYTDIGRHIYKPLNVLINMRRKYERYSEEFKFSVVRDYYSCGMSKYACVKKYNLSCGRVLNLWLLAYVILAQVLRDTLQSNT